MALQEEMEKQGAWLFKYRGVFPIFILVIGFLLYLQTEIYPEVFFLEGTRYEIYFEMFCLLISIIGLVIRIYTVGYSPVNTSGRNTHKQLAESLNVTGIYSTVRHPLYLGNFFMWLGPAAMTAHLWFVIAFIFFYWIYYERIMLAEEKFLRKKFGNVYSEWAEKIPAFVPSSKNFTPARVKFQWRKVVRQEKNGLFATFFIFSIFDISGELIENETHFNYPLAIMTLITGLAYIVIKLLKSKTVFLNDRAS